MADEAQARSDVMEIASAIVLSIAGLLTSWASFQAGLWDGEQAAHYTRANSLRTDASAANISGDTRMAMQVGLFNAWLSATAAGQTQLAEFYRVRFPPPMRGPFETWLQAKPLTNPQAPLSPFADGAVRQAGHDAAKSLNAKADAEFEAGQDANKYSDIYERATVFFAIGLFFGGIGQVFHLRWVRIGLLIVAAIGCGLGGWLLVGLPTLTAG